MKKILSRILQVAGSVSAFFASALACPVSLINWPRLVVVCVYVMALLLVRPRKVWSTYIFVLSFVIGLASGFGYWVSLDARSIRVDGNIYVKGELTETAKQYLREHSSVTEEEYFDWNRRQKSEIWTKESMWANKLVLGGLYSLFVGFTAFGILGGLERLARSKP
jgi:hypothetical protein